MAIRLLSSETIDGNISAKGNVTLDPAANSDVSIHMHANSGALGDAYAWNLIAESSADNYEFSIAQGTTDVLKFNNTAAAGNNNATFLGTVETTTLRTDVINNKANSANIIYRSGTSTLVGGGSTANKLYVLDNGKVGIGTTSPAQPLSVHGNFLVRTTNADGNKNRMQCIAGGSSDAANLYLYYGNTGDGTVSVRLNAQGDSYLNGGNLGIGTTSPSQTLEVHNTIKIGETGVAGGVLISGDSMIFQIDSDDSSNTSSYRFRCNGTADNGTELMRIQENGNVGIGTTSPSNLLSLKGSGQNYSTSPAIKMWDSYNSKGWYVGSANNHAIGDFYIRSVTSEAGYPLASGQEFTIKQSGNVGIGTISPGTKLVVSGGDDEANTGILELKTSGGTNLKIGGNTTYSWIQSHASKPLYINQLGNNIILNSGGGKVGIGTTSPTKKLTVDAGTTSGGGINIRGSSSPAIYIDETSGVVNSSFQNDGAGSYLGTSTSHPMIFRTANVAKYKITATGGHQWSTDGSFATSFTYSFRDAVGINNPNSVSAQAVAGYVLSVGRSASGSVAGGIISQGESHFVRGVSFGSSGQDQVLNYYKEGIWTPTLRFGGNEVGLTYGGAPQSVYRGGHYTKIGRIVTFSFRIILTSKGTSTGAATIQGLPFNVASLPGNYGSAMYSYANNFAIPERASITMDSGSSLIRLRFTNSSGVAGDVTNSDFNNNSDIILTGTFQAAP